MDVYNGSFKGLKKSNFIFKHLSTSPNASAERIESMFAAQERCALNADFSVDVIDINNNVTKTKTLDEHILEFCDHADKRVINKYKIIARKPLRINDLWEDDPIGSGGPKIADLENFPKAEKQEVAKIFEPFKDVIHPHHIFNIFSKKEIKAIKKKYQNNQLFKAELNKRKNRSESIGEDFKLAQYQEIVWLDISFKLKNWAINKGYDAFVYTNNKEGNGADTYIPILPNQIIESNEYFTFNREQYLSIAPQSLQNIIIERKNKYRVGINTATEEYGLMWAENSPLSFWKLM